MRRINSVTTAPGEIDAAERAEIWRLTQEAPAKYPDALDEDPVWDIAVRDGLEHD